MTTAREPALPLDQDVIATFGLVADSIDAALEWADWQLAGGLPPRWVLAQLTGRGRLIAAAARGGQPSHETAAWLAVRP